MRRRRCGLLVVDAAARLQLGATDVEPAAKRSINVARSYFGAARLPSACVPMSRTRLRGAGGVRRLRRHSVRARRRLPRASWGRPEPVKPGETLSSYLVSGLLVSGLLIHAAVGSSGGTGARRTNRSGVARVGGVEDAGARRGAAAPGRGGRRPGSSARSRSGGAGGCTSGRSRGRTRGLARSSSNRSGNSGRYFRVLNCASE